jgi:protein-S-isoprenylcysteine O-methyltransferase Ste14
MRARKAGYTTVISESRKYSISLALLIVYEVITLFIFLLFPQLLEWAKLSVPLWLRWCGTALAIASLAMFIWVHLNLGGNFSIALRIKERHTLIESGPYRWIRHPMYTAFYALHIAAFLLTDNWFIGLTWILGLTAIILLRIDREEKMMLDRFGDDYAAYMKRTGRFLPAFKIDKS